MAVLSYEPQHSLDILPHSADCTLILFFKALTASRRARVKTLSYPHLTDPLLFPGPFFFINGECMLLFSVSSN